MRLDRPREEIAKELADLAERDFGPDRARALGAHIQKTAGWLSVLGGYEFPIDGEEPDFLVAPVRPEEAL